MALPEALGDETGGQAFPGGKDGGRRCREPVPPVLRCSGRNGGVEPGAEEWRDGTDLVNDGVSWGGKSEM